MPDALFEKADAVLLRRTDDWDPVFHYFAGAEDQGAYLVLWPRQKPVLLCGALDDTAALSPARVRIQRYNSSKDAFTLLASLLGGARRIGMDGESLPASRLAALKNALPKRRWVDVSDALLRVRVPKSPKEVRAIRRAVSLTLEAISHACGSFRPGMTERDLAKRMRVYYHEADAKESFDTIVAFGKNAAVPHYLSGNTRIRGRGVLLIDTGAQLGHYCGDLTRMFVLGKPTSLEEETYAYLYDLKERAARTLSPNASIGASIAPLMDGFKERFGAPMVHTLGHGMGLEVHEYPRLHGASKECLPHGASFTIEPGHYVPGKFGIRIEDDYVMGKKKPKPLSRAPEEMARLG